MLNVARSRIVRGVICALTAPGRYKSGLAARASHPASAMTRAALVIAAACLLAPPSLAAPWLRTRGHGRVINGTEADIADFPWMVSLQILDDHVCGASIISSTWVLTAAHCIYVCQLYADRHKSMRAGSSSRASGGVRLDVAQMIKHADFQMPTDEDPDVDYDIGVIQVRGHTRVR
ncbi:trypsin-7-like [Schistocerca serialis cubense]|uniref:trypsin-7-like n=1 Tax=Schistocerca serialis cubense TaxID=2023355 RepID=UPI00214E2350|nr:trypsin-7-like [Schistocerca serialis cubense]